VPAVTATLATSKLGNFNPVAKLAVATITMIGLLITVDLVSASVLLAGELIVLFVAGVNLRVLAARIWPLPIAAAAIAIANMVASDSGAATIAAISLRLIAIALPGILVFASTDAVDLADSLVQQLRIPPRFAYGALAGLRLLPLLAADWATIHRARRARGIDAGHSPLGIARLFVSAVFGLLVAAIRRATRLAQAMDSRGFDSRRVRTVARQQVVKSSDWILVFAAVSFVALANVLAVVAGVWHPLLG
jgi:energy-coupling factor transport system permease protein